jgi:hypothetical protein
MSVSVTYAGETKPRFTSSIKRSIRRSDGSIATVITEFDQRDPDKSQRRYRKRVISAKGTILKDVDGYLTNQALHGDAGVVRDPASREVPGDPMTVRAGHTWR